jgi:hypothetical protein
LEERIRAAANLNAPPAVVEEAEAEPEEVG